MKKILIAIFFMFSGLLATNNVYAANFQDDNKSYLDGFDWWEDYDFNYFRYNDGQYLLVPQVSLYKNGYTYYFYQNTYVIDINKTEYLALSYDLSAQNGIPKYRPYIISSSVSGSDSPVVAFYTYSQTISDSRDYSDYRDFFRNHSFQTGENPCYLTISGWGSVMQGNATRYTYNLDGIEYTYYCSSYSNVSLGDELVYSWSPIKLRIPNQPPMNINHDASVKYAIENMFYLNNNFGGYSDNNPNIFRANILVNSYPLDLQYSSNKKIPIQSIHYDSIYLNIDKELNNGSDSEFGGKYEIKASGHVATYYTNKGIVSGTWGDLANTLTEYDSTIFTDDKTVLANGTRIPLFDIDEINQLITNLDTFDPTYNILNKSFYQFKLISDINVRIRYISASGDYGDWLVVKYNMIDNTISTNYRDEAGNDYASSTDVTGSNNNGITIIGSNGGSADYSILYQYLTGDKNTSDADNINLIGNYFGNVPTLIKNIFSFMPAWVLALVSSMFVILLILFFVRLIF